MNNRKFDDHRRKVRSNTFPGTSNLLPHSCTFSRSCRTHAGLKKCSLREPLLVDVEQERRRIRAVEWRVSGSGEGEEEKQDLWPVLEVESWFERYWEAGEYVVGVTELTVVFVGDRGAYGAPRHDKPNPPYGTEPFIILCVNHPLVGFHGDGDLCRRYFAATLGQVTDPESGAVVSPRHYIEERFLRGT